MSAGAIKSIADEDATPTCFGWQAKFTNGSITDNGDGTCSVALGTGNAPSTADYLVGTANGSLSAEIVVGTTPGGELGNTWASPTVDDSVTVTGWELGTATAATSLTTPTLIGGTATTADLNLQTTSGVGAAGADMHFLVGNNGATEAMTILNSGNVGIGTTGPGQLLHLRGAASTDTTILLDSVPANATAGNFLSRTSRGTFASPTNVASGDFLLQLTGQAYSGATGFWNTALIQFRVDGAVTDNQRPPSRMEFHTNAVNAAQTERMRIDNAGNVGIGTTGPDRPLSVQSNSSGNGIALLGRDNGTVDEASLHFLHNGGASEHGSIIGQSSRLDFSAAGGATEMSIIAGNVGIGTTVPAEVLHVVGDIRASGTGPNINLQHTGSDEFGLHTEAGSLLYLKNNTDNAYYLLIGGDHTQYYGTSGGSDSLTPAHVFRSSTTGNASMALPDDSIGVVELDTADDPANAEVLAYQSSTGRMVWSPDAGGGGNSFETISVPAGTNPVADSSTDTLTLTETSFLTLTGTASTDTIDITQVTTDLGTDGLISANAVALTTDTTGSYAAGDAEAGNATGVACTDCVALTTETSGNYVADVADGSGVDVTGTAGEGWTVTVNLLYTDTLAGNPALNADECRFSTDGTGGGVLCEGAADTIEGLLVWNPATSDRTLTLPDATDTVVGRATTDTLTNKTLAAADNVIDADTAVALAANGANCAAGNYPLGVNTLGAVESCTAAGASDISARVYNSVNQSISNNSETILTFDTESHDTDTMHDTVSNTGRITFTTAGKYVVGCKLLMDANATGIRFIRVRLNVGNVYVCDSADPVSSANVDNRIGCAGHRNFAAADYVTCNVYQDSGGALNASGSVNELTTLWAVKLP